MCQIRIRAKEIKAQLTNTASDTVSYLPPSQLTKLSEYIQEWNSDFTDMIAQRKTDIRRIKVKRLMTPSHMVKYGRSSYVQGLINKFHRVMKEQPEKLTKRFCQQIRDYVIINLCIMNGLCASNIIELRVSDIKEAHTNDEYPGYMVFINSLYKTSTIYGEKVIVLPKDMFKHVQFYVETARPVLGIRCGPLSKHPLPPARHLPHLMIASIRPTIPGINPDQEMRQCINKSYHAALITPENPELREVDSEPSSKRGCINK